MTLRPEREMVQLASNPGSQSRWFSGVVWTGIVANCALALPTLVMPERMLALSNLPVPEPIMWTQFAALLLLLLSAFYVPAAIDPARYRPVAVLAVAARGAGVAFFLFLQPEVYRMFGYFDLVFLLAQGWLLWRLP